MDYEEKTIDRLILGILQKDSTCNLDYISQEFKLPKTEIMKRLRYLCKNNYLQLSDSGFSTTILGDDMAVSPDVVSYSEHLYSDRKIDVGFDWKNCTYTPKPNSFSTKKK